SGARGPPRKGRANRGGTTGTRARPRSSRRALCCCTGTTAARLSRIPRKREMDADQLRETYQRFFAERGHQRIRSAPLLPENDPTVLFTTAGMHPLVPFLLGEPHPLGKRLVG